MHPYEEEQPLLGIEMTRLQHKPMSRKQALNILGLRDKPTPKLYEKKTKELLATHADDMNKQIEIHTAHHRLLGDHQFVIDYLNKFAQETYTEFEQTSHDLIDPSNTHNGHQALIIAISKQLNKLNIDYIKNLESGEDDIDILTQIHLSTFDKVLALCNIIDNTSVYDIVQQKLAGLRINLDTAYQHAAKRDAKDLNTIAIFSAEYHHYLDNILKIIQMEQDRVWEISTAEEVDDEAADNTPLLATNRYQETLRNLHRNLQQLGEKYFSEIMKVGADPMQLQKEFNKGFKHLIRDAEKSFAKAPGIWINLHIGLQIAFVCTIIPVIVILLCEKKEDLYRLFHGAPKGEVDITKIWKEMKMDVFPDPSGRPRDQSAPLHKN